MRTVTIQDAQKEIERLLRHPENDEGFVILQNGVPAIKVFPIQNNHKKKERKIGFLEGKTNLPDCLNDNHQEEIIRMFEGKDK